MNTPTSGFTFPTEMQDKAEAALRNIVGGTSERRTPVVSPVVSVVTPVMAQETTPMSDPEGISIDLPSKFAYYPFKDLYVKPFRVSHLSKLSRGQVEANMQIIVETVSSVLSTPGGDKNIAFSLTEGDFHAVLHWLRLNSFTKKRMKVMHQCTDEKHVEDVMAGRKTQESLKFAHSYTNSELSYTYMKEVPDVEKYSVTIKGQRYRLRPENMTDQIQFLDIPGWEDDKEVWHQAEIAAVIDYPASLRERIHLVANDELSLDDAVLCQEFRDLTNGFGVVEKVKTRCPGCSADVEIDISVSARSFLSPEF